MSDQPRQSGSATKESAELYLEDLFVNQRFTSGTYTKDEDLIKAFATEFDPQPFHLDGAAALATVFQGLAATAGILQQRQCVFSSRADSRWAMELSASVEI